MDKPESFITRSSSAELRFTATGKQGLGGAAKVSMPMIPLYEVMEEAYAVYFNCQGPPSEIPYSATGNLRFFRARTACFTQFSSIGYCC
eukprot:COSAG05_NODE_1503_length_4694_cov_3.721219_4_plen_89_part_00